jgi:hypothetical protein
MLPCKNHFFNQLTFIDLLNLKICQTSCSRNSKQYIQDNYNNGYTFRTQDIRAEFQYQLQRQSNMGGNAEQQQQPRQPRQSVADRLVESWNSSVNNNESYRRGYEGDNNQQRNPNSYDDAGSSVLVGNDPTNEDEWTDVVINNSQNPQPMSNSSMLKSKDNVNNISANNQGYNSRDPRDPRNSREAQKQYADTDDYDNRSHLSTMMSGLSSNVFSSNLEMSGLDSASNMSASRTDSSIGTKKSLGRGRGLTFFKR